MRSLMVTFCSIATPVTLPQVRVLTSALRREHPGARNVVVLTGTTAHHGAAEAFETLSAADILGPEASLTGTSPAALRQTLRPLALQRALADGADVAVHLDPQLCVYASLDFALELAHERGLVLVPRTKSLPDDGMRPNDADLLAAGVISPGFVAVSARDDGIRFLRWWARQVSEEGEEGGRWLDLARDKFSSAATLEDPGYNVGYWNLHERLLARDDEQVRSAGSPLRCIDFTGFRPDRPFWLSEDATRVSVVDDPILSELCGAYSEAVLAAGWSAPQLSLDQRARLGNGLPVDDITQNLWAEAVDAGHEFGDPSTRSAADAFAAWLREPAEEGAAAGVNRYLLATYRRRPDLQQAFPNLNGPDGESLIAWAWEPGHGEGRLLPQLLPVLPGTVEISADSRLAVNVIGYLSDTLGLAEAARQYVTGLSAAGIPISTTAIAPDPAVDPNSGRTIRRHGRIAYEDRRAAGEPAFNLACINGDQLGALVRSAGEEILGARPTIGQWNWETDVLPPSWMEGFKYVDEIWANTTFVAENLGRLSPVPVVVVPISISVPDPVGVELQPELRRDDRFMFLFMLDFFSTVRRKNALGLVEAFKRAFKVNEGPRLLLKTINAGFRREAEDEIRWGMGDRSDITLVDCFLGSREKTALLASADCYVSLHRSEGFGLTLAESMALGTPVIATGYSGNMDFTTPRNSYLVDWEPTRVGPECEVYPPDGSWAEPVVDHAAELMRWVWQHPEEARRKAEQARRDIDRMYAPGVVGQVARARLERLRDARETRAREPQPEGALRAVERALRFDLRRGSPPRGGLAGLARRSVLRMMLPFTVHEQNLDRALRDAVHELQMELDNERARGERTRARLRHLEETLSREDGER
jgi:Glycosyl transferases group 1